MPPREIMGPGGGGIGLPDADLGGVFAPGLAPGSLAAAGGRGSEAGTEAPGGRHVASRIRAGRTSGTRAHTLGANRAGRMIAATYAAATGYILSPRTFKLDGVPDLGVVGEVRQEGDAPPVGRRLCPGGRADRAGSRGIRYKRGQ